VKSAVLFVAARGGPEAWHAGIASARQQGAALRRLSGTCVVADHRPSADALRPGWPDSSRLHVLVAEQALSEAGAFRFALQGALQHEWLIWLDGSHAAAPGWLDALLNAAGAAASDVATVCAGWTAGNAAAPIETRPDRNPPAEVVAGTWTSVRATLMQGGWWRASGSAIRVQALRDVGQLDESLGDLADWDWLLRCLRRGWSVEYLPRTLMSAPASPTRPDTRQAAAFLQVVRKHRDALPFRDRVSLQFRYAQWLLQGPLWANRPPRMTEPLGS
jgi:hypothetical protein